MLETKEVTLNEKTFLCTQFTARTGLKLQFRLIKQVSPILAALDLPEDTKKMTDQEFGLLICKALASNIDDSKCYDLVMDLIKNVKYKNQDLTEKDFDFVFAGDYKTLFQLLAFIIELNYGNFFEADSISSLLTKEKSATKEETTLPN